MLKKILYLCASLVVMPLIGRDVLLEFKGAYFLSSDSSFKKIFNHGGALYGPEVTFQLCEDKNWYGFASIDFLSKKGKSIGLCSPTRVHLMPLALGLKYFVPFCYGDFYVGLGFQPVRLKTTNCLPASENSTSKWGYGGIAKMGTYFDLSHNFLLDIFAAYSFVHVGCSATCKSSTNIRSVKSNLSGAVFGAGLGYRFN